MTNNIKIFGTLIAVAFILIIGIVLRYTTAADVTATAEITNAAPVVDTIRVATTAYSTDNLTTGGILPNIGNDRTIHVNGQITDLNGESDIASSTISLVFHKTTSGNTCTADKNDCYIITTCDTNYTDGDDTQISYNCEVPLAYWTDATDTSSDYASDTWTSYVVASDLAAAQGTLSATIEINSLLALNLPDTIDYGTRSLGEISSSTTNVLTTITQRGNIKADVELSGTAMTCTGLGAIPATAQTWALTDIGHAGGTALSTTAASAARNIDLRTSESSELSANLYWNIAIPATGVKGTCTGSNTIAVIAQTTAAWQPSDDALLAARIGMHFRSDELTTAGSLSQWNDASGNSRNLASAGGSMPTVIASDINGRSALSFNGTNNYLTSSLPSATYGGNLSKTVYMVSWVDSSIGDNAMVFHYGRRATSQAFGIHVKTTGAQMRIYQWSNDGDFTTSSNVKGRWILHAAKKTDGNFAYYENGTSLGNVNLAPANVDLNTFEFGWRTDNGHPYFKGKVAEFVFVKDASSDTERQKIEGYLAHKYGIQSQLPSGHPYKTSAPTN